MTLAVVHSTLTFPNAAGHVIYNGGAFGPDPLQYDITYTNHQTSGVQAILRAGAAKGAPVGTNVAAFDAEHLQWVDQFSVDGALSISTQFQTFADWHLTNTWEFVIWMTTANNGTGVFDIGSMANGFGPTAGGSIVSGDVTAVLADTAAILAAVRRTFPIT